MRKIILYTATSKDWFVARPDGAIDWLDLDVDFDESEYGYAEFYDSLDVTIMGGKTYRQVLGFDCPFPYPTTTNYVLTRNKSPKTNEHVVFINSDIADFVQKLREQPGKDIWLVGGGEVSELFLEQGWVDELQAFVHPVDLGEGIPLCEGLFEKYKPQLVEEKAFSSGVVMKRYLFGKE